MASEEWSLWAQDWRVFPAPTNFASWVSRWSFLRGRGAPEAESSRCARGLTGAFGRGRGDAHSGYALDDAGLCARVWAAAGAVQERGSGRCAAFARAELCGRAWPGTEVAAAIESGGATPGPERYGGAVLDRALEVGEGQRGFAERARPDPGAGSLHAEGVPGEAGAFPGCDRAHDGGRGYVVERCAASAGGVQ